MKFLLANMLFYILTLACMLEVGEGKGERESQLNVRLDVPKYVRQGETAVLHCHYDLGNHLLYTMKWYKGSNEFYRYTPKESPPVKTFEILGLQMDLSQSNATQLTLKKVDLNMTAYYACEVTTDLPDFNAELKHSPMYVVAFPEEKPVITVNKGSYSVGDWLTANCTSYRSKPAANLTWLINSELANREYLIPAKERMKEPDSKETAQLGLKFQLRQSHFRNGKLQLKCNAKILEMYYQNSETTIVEDDRPITSSVVVSSSSSGSNGNNNRIKPGSVRSGAAWAHCRVLGCFPANILSLLSLVMISVLVILLPVQSQC